MSNQEHEPKVDDGHSDEEQRIGRYTNRQKILLVGEGDFSFAAFLAKAFRRAINLTATSLDSRETVIKNYIRGGQHLQILEEHGATVIHGVDVVTMDKHPELQHKRFDRIVFNFPQIGATPAQSLRDIILHTELVTGFFKAAVQILEKKGEVHVTHKTDDLYSMCTNNIEQYAEKAGLMLIMEAAYRGRDYPGYFRMEEYECRRVFPVGECSTFMFAIKE